MEFALTKYAEQKILNAMLLGEAITFPASWYIALCTADPGRMGDLTNEVAGGSYIRLSPTFDPAEDDPVSGSYCDSVYDLEWPQATSAWGEITHIALVDAEAGGNVWARAELVDSEGNPAPKQIGLDDIFRMPAGELVVGVD